MKLSSPALSAAAAALLAAAFAATALAQAPALPQPAAVNAPPRPPHSFPPPTNLQVLPKDLTSEQVHDIMEKWAGDLGVHCGTCHAADPANLAPNGRPRLKFADDSKPEKKTARMMFKMVDEINTQYVGKIENSGMPVTCGTCHRGHLNPEPYVAPPEHQGPPPAGAMPPNMPMPPMAH